MGQEWEEISKHTKMKNITLESNKCLLKTKYGNVIVNRNPSLDKVKVIFEAISKFQGGNLAKIWGKSKGNS